MHCGLDSPFRMTLSLEGFPSIRLLRRWRVSLLSMVIVFLHSQTECQLLSQIGGQNTSSPRSKLEINPVQNEVSTEKPSSENQFRIAVPRTSFAALSMDYGGVDNSTSTRECAMDSQFQLHQDMVFQNNYLLQRNVDTEPHTGRSIGESVLKQASDVVLITSSEDDLERKRNLQKKSSRKRTEEHSPTLLISSVLSAQNVILHTLTHL